MTKRNKKQKVFFILKLVIAIYLIAGFLLWLFQDKLLLHPKELTDGYVFDILEPHKEVTLRLNENDQLHFMKFFPADTNHIKGIVLYFHGNRENINRYARYAGNFTKHGYEVWMPDYPGFGKTTGEFTEKRVYTDAHLIYKLAISHLPADSIVLYGRSLGSGAASELASQYQCKKLILETPYYSMPAVASAHFPFYPAEKLIHYRFPVFEYLQTVKSPVSIFHGTDDEIIPLSSTERLKSIIKKTDEFITIEKGRHNNLNDFSFFHHKLDSLLQ